MEGIERRITLRLLAYWERIRGDRAMPSENDIDPEDLGDLWDYCFLIQVKDLQNKDYNYTYLGAAIMDAYRAGLSANDPGGLATPNANKLVRSYGKVVDGAKPVFDEGEFRNLHNDLVRYRQCLLPLSKDERAVDAIFGGMKFKISPG